MAAGFVLTHMPLTPWQRSFLTTWDKPMHFSLFFGMGIAISLVTNHFVTQTAWRIGIGLTLGLAIAAIDESLQMILPDRTADRYDLLANASGMLCGIIFFELIRLMVRWVVDQPPSTK